MKIPFLRKQEKTNQKDYSKEETFDTVLLVSGDDDYDYLVTDLHFSKIQERLLLGNQEFITIGDETGKEPKKLGGLEKSLILSKTGEAVKPESIDPTKIYAIYLVDGKSHVTYISTRILKDRVTRYDVSELSITHELVDTLLFNRALKARYRRLSVQ